MRKYNIGKRELVGFLTAIVWPYWITMAVRYMMHWFKAYTTDYTIIVDINSIGEADDFIRSVITALSNVIRHIISRIGRWRCFIDVICHYIDA